MSTSLPEEPTLEKLLAGSPKENLALIEDDKEWLLIESIKESTTTNANPEGPESASIRSSTSESNRSVPPP
jgi:hypothetical protein